MERVKLILDELERGFRGPAWHGPSLSEALAGVDEARARRRPLAGSHSIAELTAHAAAWKGIVASWVRGGEWRRVPAEEDWPSPGEWNEQLARLAREHAGLADDVRALDAEALTRRVGETDLAEALLGVVHHDLYHAGQIVLLGRAARTEPDRASASSSPS